MALVLKTNPVGVDFVINDIQDLLFSNLTANGVGNWTSANYESYYRAFINPKDGGTIPEVDNGTNEYKEVLMDDKFTASSFFLVDDSRDFEDSQFGVSISVIFQADIKKLFASIPHRADEEMHKDIIDAIEDTQYTEMITGFTLGVSNVYSDLSIPDSYIERVGWDDLSNYHVIKLDLEVPYKYCN